MKAKILRGKSLARRNFHEGRVCVAKILRGNKSAWKKYVWNDNFPHRKISRCEITGTEYSECEIIAHNSIHGFKIIFNF